MKLVVVLLLAASLCFGADISGIWRLKRAAADSQSFPVAVQVEQAGDRLEVLMIVATGCERHLQQMWLSTAASRAIPGATELTVADEIWTISASGQLVIHQANDQRIVLEPAEGVLE